MFLFLFVIGFIISIIAIRVAIPTLIATYQRYARAKFVICPEKQQQATIALSPRIAAISSIFIPHEIRLVKACSLWPYVNCTRTCVRQVA